jgi:predicted TIM-barrel fold metal-dependent hydrolase
VFKKGIEYGEYHAADPLFHPVYAEAARLNLPICIHTGSGDPRHTDANTGLANNAGVSNLTAIAAFTSLVLSGIPDRFPDLRFGWIEASASWLPYLIHDLEAKRKRLSALHFDLKQDLLRSSRFYVTCDTLDDLPYILGFGAEDSLMVGSDYGHADQSAEFDAVNVIRAKGRAGAIDPATADKIVNHNPGRFYGI